jgi:cytidylate kinase
MAKTYLKFLEPYEKELLKKIKKKGLTITVSGLSGTGKTDGARALAEAFKLNYVSAGQILRQIAKERKVSLEELCNFREPEIDHEMDRRNLEFAMKGNIVIDARLSGWCAGDWADVKVYYECPLNIKAERVARRDNITVEEAKKNLEKRDEEDHSVYQKLYGIDSYDKSIYDVIIDNEKLSKEESKIVPVKLVGGFLKKKKIL